MVINGGDEMRSLPLSLCFSGSCRLALPELPCAKIHLLRQAALTLMLVPMLATRSPMLL
jgi:hypothetical protein